MFSLSVIVEYQVPATGTRSQQIAYRQSLWMASMWHVTGLQASGLHIGAEPLSPAVEWHQNGVNNEGNPIARLLSGDRISSFFGTRSS